MEHTNLKMFSLHFIEDEDGTVTVCSDWIGSGFGAFAIGKEIMETLLAIQPHTNGELRIELPIVSNLQH